MSDHSDFEDDSMDQTSVGPNDPRRHQRAQHNALERRRRDSIKGMFEQLRDSVPDNGSTERASRASILKNAIIAIEQKTHDVATTRRETETIKAENDALQAEIDRLKHSNSSSSGQNPVISRQ